MTYASDIPMSLAVSAFHGTSWSPEKRGQLAVSEYGQELSEVHETLKQHAEKGGTIDLLDEEFARFRAGYRKRYTAWLASHSRVMSSFITGPANFPVRRNAKRIDVCDRRMSDLFEFKARAVKAAIRHLRPDLRPIMSGDADAVERLEAQIRQAERLQQRMKEANAAIRKYKKAGREAQLAALVELGFSDARAATLLEPDFCGRIGFPDYALTNNNANIRRMKQRVEQISRAKATPDSTIEGANGVTLDDCPAENRVRLTFPGKPAEAIRSKLKKNGFRWTPSLGVWQAYRNSSSIALAREIAGGTQW